MGRLQIGKLWNRGSNLRRGNGVFSSQNHPGRRLSPRGFLIRYLRRFPLVYSGLIVKLATIHLVSGFMTDAAVSPLYHMSSCAVAQLARGKLVLCFQLGYL